MFVGLAAAIAVCVAAIAGMVILGLKPRAPPLTQDPEKREILQDTAAPAESPLPSPAAGAAVYVPRTSQCRPGGGGPVIVGRTGLSNVFRGLGMLGDNEFAVCWNSGTRTPAWTAHRIGRKASSIKRGSRFGNKMGSEWQVPSHDEYKVAVTRNGYDRGHLVPFADFEEPNITMDMVNVIPQNRQCNRGVWKDFEEDLRADYLGHVCVTVAMRSLDAFSGTQFSLPTGLWAPAGLCKIILRFDGSVEYWGCVKHDEESCTRPYEDFSDEEMRYRLSEAPTGH